ncbi:mycosin-1 [Nocardia neocaledoniensis NBRC 108232]|uniref:Membrane-anchored mycosin MYCP n=1 Tax=Nocardia neocaledoniensis TaxID=236511 RepID=A0A317N5X5_9NOCA|nr:type VII secretion-associated serine protease mycosin [Nocardia neocaledoniensis]PWV66965.1 membrane-anchored mycosin MYCP [Nocardia neocaledoniensis]GEM31298.1 mycosin-1 [Nocardia neocaledoniensis NBRC 108232]
MRIGVFVAVILILATGLLATAPAAAVDPPEVVVGVVPADLPPGPETPMKQDKGCLAAGVLPHSDMTRTPPADLALGLGRARELSRGAGVKVAVIDTGVEPNRRLPNVVGGGDFVTAGGDGLSDCDAHGTLIAGIIAAAPDPQDPFVGVAPDAEIISIRLRSGAFSAERPPRDPAEQTAIEIRTLARAITHAANLGAGVIVVSIPICLPAGQQPDQSAVADALGYAVHVRGSLVVAGAGQAGSGCEQNPDIDPAAPRDPRNWRAVRTISTPGWYHSAVLTVGYTGATGSPADNSLRGPWVSVAAPGVGIESLGPGDSGLVNGVGAPGNLVPVGGASFAAAYVAGVAALLRSRFPHETSGQIIARLRLTAHASARGVDNAVGAGLIDPLGALAYRSPPEPAAGTYQASRFVMPAAPKRRDPLPGVVASVVMGVAVLLGAAGIGARAMVRTRR